MRRTPSHNFFASFYQRLANTGSFQRAAMERERTTRTSDMEENVRQQVQETSCGSTRSVAHAVGVSRSTAWRILRENGMHPHHEQRVQQLHLDDYAPRIAFAQRYLQVCVTDHRFPANTGAAKGMPEFDRCSPDSVNRVLGRVSLGRLLSTVFSSHHDLDERAPWLRRAHFFGKWPFSHRDAESNARSPDLSICDFFLLGYLKEKVVKHRPHTQNRITEEVNAVPIQMCRNAARNFQNRFHQCIAAGLRHLADIVFKY